MNEPIQSDGPLHATETNTAPSVDTDANAESVALSKLDEPLESVGAVDVHQTKAEAISLASRFLWFALVLLSLIFTFLLIVKPIFAILIEPKSMEHVTHAHSELTQEQKIVFTILEGATYLWFFTLGGAFGSFLNCAAFRIPRNISLVGRGSFCPKCDQRIPIQFNFPVFGWLLLRGRCFECRQPIPPRYVLVELIFASTFALIAQVEIIAGGWNLPLRPMEFYSGVLNAVWFPNVDLIGMALFHATLCILVYWISLFELERRRLPLSVAGFALVVLAVPPLLFPALSPVCWDGSYTSDTIFGGAIAWEEGIRIRPVHFWGLERAASTLLLGGITSGVIGMATGMRMIRSRDQRGWITAHVLVGMVMGWQVGLGVGLASSLLLLISRTPTLSRMTQVLPATGAVGVAMFSHLAFWRPIHIVATLAAPMIIFSTAVGLLIVVAFLGKRVPRLRKKHEAALVEPYAQDTREVVHVGS